MSPYTESYDTQKLLEGGLCPLMADQGSVVSVLSKGKVGQWVRPIDPVDVWDMIGEASWVSAHLYV